MRFMLIRIASTPAVIVWIRMVSFFLLPSFKTEQRTNDTRMARRAAPMTIR